MQQKWPSKKMRSWHRKASPRGQNDTPAGLQPILELRGVTKVYEDGVTPFTALNAIDAVIYPGEYVGVIGKSGAGKTTLVNMITGVDSLTSGQVLFQGMDTRQFSESQMSLWRGRNIGVVLQSFQLLPTLSLVDNILLSMDFCGTYDARRSYERALRLLEQVELQDHAYKKPSAISGGQQQRVAIARALANDPPLIIGDEPTGSLDSVTAETIYQIFDDLVKQGKTILIATHDTSLSQRAHRNLLLSNGELIHPAVAQALPLLSHEQMLEVTHLAQVRTFMPGEVLIHQGEALQLIYIIDQGQVEIGLERPGAGPVQVDRLGPGELPGMAAVLDGGIAPISAWAASGGPVRALALPIQPFNAILASSEEMREALVEKAQAGRAAINQQKGGSRYETAPAALA